MKYERREISWASFLFAAGWYSDGTQRVKEPCEYFYELLNTYEDSDFHLELERSQQQEIFAKVKDEIDAIRPLYQMFKRYYKKYIENRTKERSYGDDAASIG